MLIRVKNKDLYLRWIRFLTEYKGYKEDATTRTEAFFATQRDEKPPFNY